MNENKPRAVALHFDGKNAPTVVAKGDGSLAQHIINTAKSYNIPIQKNEELTALLANVQLSDEIPTPLYYAVAQILALIYHLNDKKSGS
ncbi:MAG: flagellar biosynthesis protein FlhB [Legionella sp.]|nr:MAG: flagellar biosynthesis protein FlhB [Legionella sp.]